MFVGLGWVAVVVMVALLATQVLGWSGNRQVVMLQALTPYVLAPALPIAVVALLGRQWPLAATCTAITVAFGVMCRPLIRRRAATSRPGCTSSLTVFHGNLLYENGVTGALPGMLIGLGADVLAFTEYTDDHSELLCESPLADAFPHRIEHAEGRSGGSAIWSRYPLTEIATPKSRDRSSAAVVAAPSPVTLFVVHPPSPLMSHGGWTRELDGLRALDPDTGDPTLVVGDFNADYWHPPFRRLLAVGWRSAHLETGRGFTHSWPTDRRPFPPFVRLDHALVNDRLVVGGIRDVDTPGSDHRGLVVTVATVDS